MRGFRGTIGTFGTDGTMGGGGDWGLRKSGHVMGAKFLYVQKYYLLFLDNGGSRGLNAGWRKFFKFC